MLQEMLNKRNLTYKEIAEVQSILNSKADPNNPNWKEVRTENDFKLASILEMAEMIESTPWKWWKGGNADLWNIKIELIDMLHFMISNVAMRDSIKDNEANKVLGFKEDEKIVKAFFYDNDENKGADRDVSMDIFKALVNDEYDFDFINEVVKGGGLEANEISSIYIAKYTLNEIRWEGGYALNQYKKMKSGYVDENGNAVEAVEDNVFLKELVDDFKNNETMTLKELRENVIERLNSL